MDISGRERQQLLSTPQITAHYNWRVIPKKTAGWTLIFHCKCSCSKRVCGNLSLQRGRGGLRVSFLWLSCDWVHRAVVLQRGKSVPWDLSPSGQCPLPAIPAPFRIFTKNIQVVVLSPSPPPHHHHLPHPPCGSGCDYHIETFYVKTSNDGRMTDIKRILEVMLPTKCLLVKLFVYGWGLEKAVLVTSMRLSRLHCWNWCICDQRKYCELS